MAEQEKFCLKWNDFERNISLAFKDLRDDRDFFDVTLACENSQIQAHKVILSACSPFFRGVLKQNPHQHPLLYLKDVRYKDLESVLNFMYHGEVNVAQDQLNSFLLVAEDLQVKGLTQSNSSSSGNINTTSDHHHGEQRTPSTKKRALRAERQSYRKHAPVVRSAKTIWNELRLKTNDATTNVTLCAELHGLLRGKCMEVAMQHDASRCVQGVLQFGTEDMKRDVVMELCRVDDNNVFGSGDAAATTATAGGKKGAAVTTASSANNSNNSNNNDKATMKKDESKMNLAELCKIQYAHFVVLKMIKYCARDEVCVKLIVKVRERGTNDIYRFNFAQGVIIIPI